MKHFMNAVRTMTFKEAVDYIWEYYKLPIIGILGLVIFSWMFVDGLLAKEEDPLQIMIISEAPTDVIQELEMSLNEANPNDTFVHVENIHHQAGSITNNGYQQLQKLSASLSVGQVDILIAELPLAVQLIEEELLLPVTDVISDKLFVDLQKQAYVDPTGSMYGIATNQLNPLFSSSWFDEAYAFIPATSNNLANMDTFLSQWMK